MNHIECILSESGGSPLLIDLVLALVIPASGTLAIRV